MLISMPRFNGINFYQTRPKIKFSFAQKIQNFLAVGLRPQTPITTPPIVDFWLSRCL